MGAIRDNACYARRRFGTAAIVALPGVRLLFTILTRMRSEIAEALHEIEMGQLIRFRPAGRA